MAPRISNFYLAKFVVVQIEDGILHMTKKLGNSLNMPNLCNGILFFKKNLEAESYSFSMNLQLFQNEEYLFHVCLEFYVSLLRYVLFSL